MGISLSSCGETNSHKPLFDEENNTVTYGFYPQSVVHDEIEALDKLTDADREEKTGWYLYNNEYYAKIASEITAGQVFDDGSGVLKGKSYWFKCEPIVWKVLSNTSDGCLLISDTILYMGTVDGLNGYSQSYVRRWLNNDFYKSAFFLHDKSIKLKEVDNSVNSIDGSDNPNVCENTQDKVFLPSVSDLTNSEYGFSKDSSGNNARRAKLTEYARLLGMESYDGYGSYLTRSPDSSSSRDYWTIEYDGSLKTNYAGAGIRPCIEVSK